MSDVIDNRTIFLDLPQPHPSNDLEDDVVRLRASFTALDAHTRELQVDLGAQAEEVAANKADAEQRLAALVSPEVAPDKVWSSERAAAEIGRGAATTYHYDPATGELIGVVETLPGGIRTTSFSYEGGRLVSEVESHAGCTRTTAYRYDTAGLLASTTTTEETGG